MESDRPPLKISIITPSLNQRPYLEEALLSVKEQNYPAVEHIVADGASTDGSVDVLKGCASRPGWDHLRWLSEPDRGQSDALNKCLSLASGDIVGWLNSDERYRLGCFQYVAAAFRQHSDVQVIYGDHTWIDENGRLLQVRPEIEFSSFILHYHRVLYIPSVSTFFRRRIFQAGDLFDTNLENDMDYEFFLRLVHRGYRFKHLHRLLADYRWHAQCKSSTQNERILQQHDRTLQKYSPILQKLPVEALRKPVLFGLRTVAAALRYSEKLMRGYYFTQFFRKDRDS